MDSYRFTLSVDEVREFVQLAHDILEKPPAEARSSLEVPGWLSELYRDFEQLVAHDIGEAATGGREINFHALSSYEDEDTRDTSLRP